MTSPSLPGTPEDAPGASPSPALRPEAGTGPGLPLDPFGPADGQAVVHDVSLERLRKDARKRGDRKAAGRAFWKELPILIRIGRAHV